MAASAIVLLACGVMMISAVFAVRSCLRAARRRRPKRLWDDLLIHEQALDRELDRIWHRG